VKRLVVAVLGLVVVLGEAGCGIQVQDEAVPLPAGALTTITPVPPQPRGRETTVYFVSGRTLQGVPEPITDRSANGVMAAIAAGPPVDRQAGLRTLLLDPLTAAPVLDVADVTPNGQVVLQRNEAFLQLPATDQVLLIAQIVLSMDEIGLSQVAMVDAQGAEVPVPLPDGRVQEGSVRAKDYAELLDE
jgi:hypothetical protein